jgi:hypothetical protein
VAITDENGLFDARGHDASIRLRHSARRLTLFARFVRLSSLEKTGERFCDESISVCPVMGVSLAGDYTLAPYVLSDIFATFTPTQVQVSIPLGNPKVILIAYFPSPVPKRVYKGCRICKCFTLYMNLIDSTGGRDGNAEKTTLVDLDYCDCSHMHMFDQCGFHFYVSTWWWSSQPTSTIDNSFNGNHHKYKDNQPKWIKFVRSPQ